jgi:hypothetical protein
VEEEARTRETTLSSELQAARAKIDELVLRAATAAVAVPAPAPAPAPAAIPAGIASIRQDLETLDPTRPTPTPSAPHAPARPAAQPQTVPVPEPAPVELYPQGVPRAIALQRERATLLATGIYTEDDSVIRAIDDALAGEDCQ